MGQQQFLQPFHLLMGDAQQFPRRIADLAALDAVFEAVLVNGGEAVGRADKLDHGLMFGAGCLEPAGADQMLKHLAAGGAAFFRQLLEWFARGHGVAIGLEVGPDSLGLAGAQGAGHFASQLAAGGGFHAGQQAIGPAGQAAQVVGGHG